MELIDSHGHLTDEKYKDDLEEVLTRAGSVGVLSVVSAGYDFLSSKQSLELAKKYASVFATVGIHPENVGQSREQFCLEFEKIKELATKDRVVAIGEIGLDYHYFDGLDAEKIAERKALQREAFVGQIELANALNKPIVVHSRDAMGDTIDILRANKPKRESLLHCYAGSVESAKILMELGFSFSFGGVVTFKNSKQAVEVVKALPLDRILIETDCPYLSPEPFRGKRNEPKNVVYVADMIARIKGLSLEEVAEVTTQNAKRLFGI